MAIRIRASLLTTTTETGGVAYMAHIGGFVAGLVLVKLMVVPGGQRSLETPAISSPESDPIALFDCP